MSEISEKTSTTTIPYSTCVDCGSPMTKTEFHYVEEYEIPGCCSDCYRKAWETQVENYENAKLQPQPGTGKTELIKQSIFTGKKPYHLEIKNK